MWFMTLVDTNCIMITGMSHSNDPTVQESGMENSTCTNKYEDTG